MERLPTALIFERIYGQPKQTHLSYYNEIRPIVLSIDLVKRSLRNCHTIVFRLLREHGLHPGTRVICFQ